MGRRSARVLCLLGALWPCLTWAAAPDDGEEDDPAFARRKAQPKPAPAPAQEDDDSDPTPTPQPTPQPQPPPPPRPRPPRHAAAAAADDRWVPAVRTPRAGLHMRLAYRHLTIPEVKDVQQHLGDDDFNGLSFDLYPLSSFVRLGLSTQAALESGGDFVISEGVTLGLTLPHARFAPFVEAGAHGGVGQRSVWIPTDDHTSDFPTLFLLFTGEVGLDARLGEEAALSVAVGLQRSSFYLSLGDVMSPVVVVHDVTTTFKVGIGF